MNPLNLPPVAAAAERLAAGDAASWPEPTVVDLEAIEGEWPLLAAELAVVDAECAFAISPDAIARRRLRRAHAARNRAATNHHNHTVALRRTP